MCFGNKAAKQAAAEAAQAKADMERREQERQAKIRTGQSSIDEIFGQFDPAYYDKYKSDYIGAQQPEIGEQYGKAKSKAIAALANRGIDESSIAANTYADIEKTKTKAEGDLANTATDAANDFRGKVEKQKSDLYALNSSAADPNMIASRATGEATALVPQKPSSDIGDIFASVLTPLNNFARAGMYSPLDTRFRGFGAGSSGGSSGRVVS